VVSRAETHNEGKEGIMIHRRKRISAPPPIAPKTVRVLRGPRELEEAVERASAFERRHAEEFRRRVGHYDQYLSGEHRLADLVAVHSSSDAG
jgi:hypothetical protein